ncbi:MAG: MFS transporter [Marinosulfonomonas sp.]
MSQPNALPRYALYAAVLASAGLPIYIHAPKFYVDSYAISLTDIAAALVLLRLIDVVQDPLLGKLASRLGRWRSVAAAIGACGLAVGMIGLFMIPALLPPILWLSLCLAVLFTSFSFLTILFYARGITQADQLGRAGHVRLAGWRETGALMGVSVACILPFVAQQFGFAPYAGFTIVFCGLVLCGAIAMHGLWKGPAAFQAPSFSGLLKDREIRRLLCVAVLNAAPVAITSTLFLFFVEYRLQQPENAGVYLLAFFLAAAAAAPLWTRLAQRFGAMKVLTVGMLLSILGFAWASGLGTGDGMAFLVVCVLSGAALGADMTLLPALFAKQVVRIDEDGALAFGLWNFCAKLTLALAAASVLPLLEQGGFRVGAVNDESALGRLSVLYAVLPCVLKLFALVFLWIGRSRSTETAQ